MRCKALVSLLLLTLSNPTDAKSSSRRALVLPASASIRPPQQQQQKQDALSKKKVPLEDQYATTTQQPTTGSTTTSTTPSTTTSTSTAMNTIRPRGGTSTSTASAFRTRVLSAVLMLSGLAATVQYGGNAGVIRLIAFFQAAMYHEATSVVGIFDATKWWWFLTYFCTITAKLIFPDVESTLMNFIGFGMAVDGIVALVLQQNRQGAESFGKALGDLAGYNVAALVMIGFSAFWILTIQQYGMKWVGYPAALVAINDTMAYFFGVLFGKHPLLAKISPKKTWEGFIGAALSTMGLSVPVWGLFFGTTPVHAQHVIGLAVYVSLAAPFGGFLASIVKRTYGQKDFGSLIPGHGGLVDRLDCQLMVAPFVYLGLQHFGTATAPS